MKSYTRSHFGIISYKPWNITDPYINQPGWLMECHFFQVIQAVTFLYPQTLEVINNPSKRSLDHLQKVTLWISRIVFFVCRFFTLVWELRTPVFDRVRNIPWGFRTDFGKGFRDGRKRAIATALVWNGRKLDLFLQQQRGETWHHFV